MENSQKMENLARAERELADFEFRRSASTSSTPKSVVLEITGRCIGNCRACYACSNRSLEDMTKEDAFRTVDILAGLKYEDVYVTGGEPMTNPDLAFATCEYARSQGLRAILVTTGYRLNSPEMAEKALEVTDRIEFSVRSHDPLIHNRIVAGGLPGESASVPDNVPGNFNTVMEAMKTVSDLKSRKGSATKIAVNHDAYPGSSPYLIMQALNSRGISADAFYVQLIALTGKTGQEAENLKQSYFLPRDALLRIIDELFEIRRVFGVDDIGFTDNPVKHEETDILSEATLPEAVLPLIADDIPAIAPDFHFRENVTRLDRASQK